jgi:hypothetical protein
VLLLCLHINGGYDMWWMFLDIGQQEKRKQRLERERQHRRELRRAVWKLLRAVPMLALGILMFAFILPIGLFCLLTGQKPPSGWWANP